MGRADGDDGDDDVMMGAGYVDTLLKEYKENQELVRNMGASHYQVIYPVQLRHRETIGISTREIGATKVNVSRAHTFSPTSRPSENQPTHQPDDV